MKAILKFIDIVDGINLRIGKVAMFGLFALMAVLLWSSVSKTFFTPSLWTLETAQFIMVGYYMLGGPYSILMGSNVRMDLFLMKAMAPPEIGLRDIYRSILPFVLVMALALIVIMAFPDIALWLPHLVYGT